MIKPVVINHGGNRDSYQVALAFEGAGLLHRLITDFYIDLESGIWRPFRNSDFLNKRYNPKLPSEKIIVPADALLNELFNRIITSPKITALRNSILANAAFEEAKRSDANLFLYSYTAFEAFQKARIEGPTMKKNLFQVHPSPDFIKDILVEELDRYPFAKQSILFENEMRGGFDMERLREEPLMADNIFVASSFTKKSLVYMGIDQERIVVVPYGLAFDLYPYRGRKPVQKKFNILFVGQFIQRKGVADLLTALKWLSSPNISLTVCSRGYFDQNILNAFPEVDIIVKRNLKHSELILEMKAADLFVFPSLAEGFGFVILEAMHSGIPVITTHNTCGADIIKDGDNGYLIPAKDPLALAEKINYCIENNDTLLEVAYNGHCTAALYNWEKFRKGIINHYMQIANN